jgi:hypothetical protein
VHFRSKQGTRYSFRCEACLGVGHIRDKKTIIEAKRIKNKKLTVKKIDLKEVRKQKIKSLRKYRDKHPQKWQEILKKYRKSRVKKYNEYMREYSAKRRVGYPKGKRKTRKKRIPKILKKSLCEECNQNTRQPYRMFCIVCLQKKRKELRKLNPKHNDDLVIKMRDIYGMKFAEMGVVLGTSVQAAHKRYFKIKKCLTNNI